MWSCSLGAHQLRLSTSVTTAAVAPLTNAGPAPSCCSILLPSHPSSLPGRLPAPHRGVAARDCQPRVGAGPLPHAAGSALCGRGPGQRPGDVCHTAAAPGEAGKCRGDWGEGGSNNILWCTLSQSIVGSTWVGCWMLMLTAHRPDLAAHVHAACPSLAAMPPACNSCNPASPYRDPHWQPLLSP